MPSSTPTKPLAAAPPQSSAAAIALWGLSWFAANLLITFYSKHVLSGRGISPLINTFVQMLGTGVVCAASRASSLTKADFALTRGEFARLAGYSLLFGMNIVSFQAGLKYTSVSLNQIVRATSPAIMAALELGLLGKRHSAYNMLPLAPVCLGVALTATGELHLSTFGLIVCIASTVVCALKGVLTAFILQDLKSKLDEYLMLMFVTPMVAAQVLLLFVWEEQGSLTAIQAVVTENWDALLASALLAASVNVFSFGTIKRTSAVTMGVLGGCKQVLVIVISVMALEGGSAALTPQKALGVVLALCGGSLYTYRKLQTKRRQQLEAAMGQQLEAQEDEEGSDSDSPSDIEDGGLSENSDETSVGSTEDVLLLKK